jgi:hypothetical protein
MVAGEDGGVAEGADPAAAVAAKRKGEEAGVGEVHLLYLFVSLCLVSFFISFFKKIVCLLCLCVCFTGMDDKVCVCTGANMV